MIGAWFSNPFHVIAALWILIGIALIWLLVMVIREAIRDRKWRAEWRITRAK